MSSSNSNDNDRKNCVKKEELTQVPWTRHALLAIAIAMLAVGLLVRFSPYAEPGSREFLSGSLIKVSIVVGLAWVAAPQLERLGWERLRGTGIVVLMIAGAATAIRPRLGAIIAGMAIGGFVLLAMLGWVRGIIFNGNGTDSIRPKTGKIEKNPTKR